MPLHRAETGGDGAVVGLAPRLEPSPSLDDRGLPPRYLEPDHDVRRKRIAAFLTALLGLFGLGGCSTVEIDATAARPLAALNCFNGTLDAHGVFQDRSGKVVKRFQVVIDAGWKGDTGTLDERFTYSDGSTQRQVWTITPPG